MVFAQKFYIQSCCEIISSQGFSFPLHWWHALSFPFSMICLLDDVDAATLTTRIRLQQASSSSGATCRRQDLVIILEDAVISLSENSYNSQLISPGWLMCPCSDTRKRFIPAFRSHLVWLVRSLDVLSLLDTSDYCTFLVHCQITATHPWSSFQIRVKMK